jgi:hypothetical protein
MDGERWTVLAHSIKYHYRSEATSTSFEFCGAKLLENIPNLINGGCINHIERRQRTDAACKFQAFLHMPISMITIVCSYCQLRETQEASFLVVICKLSGRTTMHVFRNAKWLHSYQGRNTKRARKFIFEANRLSATVLGELSWLFIKSE